MFRPYSHLLLNKIILLLKTILNIKRYYSEVGQHHLKIISKMLEKPREENIEKLLKLVWCTRTNITNKDFLNMFKLINVVKGGLKEELDLF